ncbi:MAG: LysM domain-containing protein [Bacteroidetes bacterium]|nr:LysM domain-containing protein [Bacteroidota bacterium]
MKVYVVQKGDTLWSIAQKYPGVSIEEIKQWNNLKGGRSIWVGQKIKIQSKG